MGWWLLNIFTYADMCLPLAIPLLPASIHGLCVLHHAVRCVPLRFPGQQQGLQWVLARFVPSFQYYHKNGKDSTWNIRNDGWFSDKNGEVSGEVCSSAFWLLYYLTGMKFFLLLRLRTKKSWPAVTAQLWSFSFTLKATENGSGF